MAVACSKFPRINTGLKIWGVGFPTNLHRVKRPADPNLLYTWR